MISPQGFVAKMLDFDITKIKGILQIGANQNYFLIA
jgi:hypothetical protein